MSRPLNVPPQAGDKLSFIVALEVHFDELSVAHTLELGDELVVVEVDFSSERPVCVSDPRALTWRAWINHVVAQQARRFWLELQERMIHNEGISSPLPVEYWSADYAQLSHADRVRLRDLVRDATLYEFLSAYLRLSGGTRRR